MPQMMISADRRRRRRRKRNWPRGEERTTTVSSDASALAGNAAYREVWLARHLSRTTTPPVGSSSAHVLPL